MKLRIEFALVLLIATVLFVMLAVNLIRGFMGMGWNW